MVIVYRKVLIVFVSVFAANISRLLQGLLAFLILIIAFLVQIIRMPYNHSSLNKIENVSIITAGTTIYCGLLYLTESLNEITKLVFFIIILLSNFIFIILWSSRMFQTLLFKAYGIVVRRRSKVDLETSVKSLGFQNTQILEKIQKDTPTEIEKDTPTLFDIQGRPSSPQASLSLSPEASLSSSPKDSLSPSLRGWLASLPKASISN